MKHNRTFDDLFREARKQPAYWEEGAILEFTEELVREMERQHVSRAELARRLGTSPAYITKILRGDANFTLATMVKLARALDTELRLALAPAQSREESRDRRLAARSGARTRGARRPHPARSPAAHSPGPARR